MSRRYPRRTALQLAHPFEGVLEELGGELLGDLEREVGVEAALLVDEGQLVQLARRILLELGGLLGEVGPLGVGL